MAEPIPCKDCGKETGSRSPRCAACEEKRRAQWQAWLGAGKCPRCEGRRDLDPGTKSCFECGFGVDQPREGIEDWVPLAVKNPRRFRKL